MSHVRTPNSAHRRLKKLRRFGLEMRLRSREFRALLDELLHLREASAAREATTAVTVHRRGRTMDATATGRRAPRLDPACRGNGPSRPRTRGP